jgi:hypothetical protein
MTKIVKSKSKTLRSSLKKPAKKALKAKRAVKAERSRSKQRDSAEPSGSKQDQRTVKLSTLEPVRAAIVERTHRFPRPFLLPFAVVDMWFRAAEPKGDSK